MFTEVSEECAASVFFSEDGDIKFLANVVGIFQTSRHHIIEDSRSNLHGHPREKLISRSMSEVSIPFYCGVENRSISYFVVPTRQGFRAGNSYVTLAPVPVHTLDFLGCLSVICCAVYGSAYIHIPDYILR
jgi:hypothetical protein